jgi:hypothetical protein
VIIWHSLTNPEAHYSDLGSAIYPTRINLERRKRNHGHQLEAMGYTVNGRTRRRLTTSSPVPDPPAPRRRGRRSRSPVPDV